MEDELRPLPEGWLRQYDPETHHQFFIDNTASPPRSVWSHPYDDKQYLSTLSPAERERVTRLHHSVSLADIEAESSDDDTHQQQQQQQHPELPPRKSPNDANDADDANPTGIRKFGRRMKDKLTHSTHAERERARQQRAEQERRTADGRAAVPGQGLRRPRRVRRAAERAGGGAAERRVRVQSVCAGRRVCESECAVCEAGAAV